MSESDVAARLTSLGNSVDNWTRDAMRESVQEPAERLRAMLEYHFGWRETDLRPAENLAPAGKKLRPALVLLVSEGVCGSITPGRDAAVAVELIHNFSLVHDDIQDNSPLRRHRAALWSVWGMEQGINAGDALFALAQLVLLRTSTEKTARLALILNQACLRLAEGQYLDIYMQQGVSDLDLQSYEAMIARKTGALFECACRMGAIAAGAPDAVVEAYASYGRQLGLAFQEQDDILGVWGASEETGKPRAGDVAGRKKGLIAALALSEPDHPQWLLDAYRPAETDMSPELIERVIEYFEDRGLRDVAEQRVRSRHEAALACLEEAAPRAPVAAVLRGICETLIERRF